MKKLIFAFLLLLVCARLSLAGPEPQYLLEARMLAIEVSGELRPPEDVTELILNDLAAIRAVFPDVADITYRMPFVPDEIMVGLTEEAIIQFQQGQYHALDELNELYGVIDIKLHWYSSLGFGFLLLKFDRVYNAELLSDIYEQANPDGLRHAQPNHLIGDGSTISVDLPFYTFTRKWGDCPAGCTGSESFCFEVEDGLVTPIGRDQYYVDAVYGSDDNNGLDPNTAFATIQKAVDTAFDSNCAGDTVIVAPGIYTGPGNRDIHFEGRTITVRSAEPSDPNIIASTIIDCNGTKSEPHRAFHISSHPETPLSVDIVVAGFNIRNGYATKGGGIYCDTDSSPTITNCIITGNSADYGGGLYGCNGPINNCTITGNSATLNGGGIYGCNGPITDCTITGNSTEFCGGGLAYCNGLINNCLIAENSAGEGGGLSSCDGSVINCKITANSSIGTGGGFAFCLAAVTNCIIAGNSAGFKYCAGAMDSCKGPITNCTITGNSAGAYGVLDLGPGSGPITNCIIWGNGGNPIFYKPRTSIQYSNVQGGYEGLGNINTDPCFIVPGCWVDANEPNIIVEPNDPNAIWLDGDYHLLPTSPCIDAGDPNYVPEPNETDLDGNPRIRGPQIDMGAYESIMHQARLWLWPRVINRKSHWPRWITAQIYLPAGITKDDIDEDTPLALYPGGVQAVHQAVLQNRGRFDRRTRIIALFDGEEFLQAVDTNGPILLMAHGYLVDHGQFFHGFDTIRITPPPPKRPWWWRRY